MATTTRQELGIYWDSEGLFCVETSGTIPLKNFFIPFKLDIEAFRQKKDYGPSETEVQIGSLIKKSFEQNRVTQSTVNICLPTRDIIFRSFIIPWMQSHEVKNVVQFEASKYVPFALKDLVYSFHPVAFKDNELQRIRIIFAAIKKDIPDYYTHLLNQTNLEINFIEPAPLSLIRLFMLKKLISLNQAFGILEYQGQEGTIVIVDQGVPQFVREFRLDSQQVTESSPQFINFFTNEITISMEYVNRQNNLRIQQLILITPAKTQDMAKSLERELELSVIPLNSETIFGNPSIKEIGYLDAYGVALTQSIAVPAQLSLSSKKLSQVDQPAVSSKEFDFKPVVKTVIGCVLFLIINFLIIHQLNHTGRHQAASLKEKLGNQATPVEELKTQNIVFQKKIDYFKNLRTKSEITPALLTIPQLLPQGTWLKSLTISYEDPEIKPPKDTTAKSPKAPSGAFTIKMEGYSYSKNREEQFRLVNTFLKNVKEDSYFSRHFKKIEIETIRAQKIEEDNVTAFTIKCQ